MPDGASVARDATLAAVMSRDLDAEIAEGKMLLRQRARGRGASRGANGRGAIEGGRGVSRPASATVAQPSMRRGISIGQLLSAGCDGRHSCSRFADVVTAACRGERARRAEPAHGLLSLGRRQGAPPHDPVLSNAPQTWLSASRVTSAAPFVAEHFFSRLSVLLCRRRFARVGSCHPLIS